MMTPSARRRPLCPISFHLTLLETTELERVLDIDQLPSEVFGDASLSLSQGFGITPQKVHRVILQLAEEVKKRLAFWRDGWLDVPFGLALSQGFSVVPHEVHCLILELLDHLDLHYNAFLSRTRY